MKSSCLRFPRMDRFIRVHESLLIACDRNACAAALIAFFEGWHNYKIEQKEYTELYNTMAKDAKAAPIIDVSGWQFHTMAQLQAGVLIYREDAINTALELLEKKEFIETEVPVHLRILHKTGRTRWFLLRADKINTWFDGYENERRPKKLVFPPPRKTPKPEKGEVTGERRVNALAVLGYRNKRRVEYWQKRGRNVTPDKMTAKQISYVADRLREGFTPEQLAHAFEGCLASEFHMGLMPNKPTVYDGVKVVYATADKVNQFIGYANTAGLRIEATASRFADGTANIERPPVDVDGLAKLVAEYLLSGAPDKLAALKPKAGEIAQARIAIKAAARWLIIARVGIFNQTHTDRLTEIYTEKI